MDQPRDLQLAAFLRRQHGEMTYARFSRETGLPPPTRFRLENCQQSVTVNKLEGVLKRLKASVSDVFRDAT